MATPGQVGRHVSAGGDVGVSLLGRGVHPRLVAGASSGHQPPDGLGVGGKVRDEMVTSRAFQR